MALFSDVRPGALLGFSRATWLLLSFAVWPGVGLLHADETKIALTPAMVINEGAIGNGSALVDEQALSGDPVNHPPGGNPVTQYFSGYGSPGDWAFPANFIIDLGTNYHLTHICLYDSNGVGNVTFSSGTPFAWTPLFTDSQNSYNSWSTHAVNVTTRYVQISIASAGAIPNEILLYGTPLGTPAAPPVPQRPAPLPFEQFIGINTFINEPLHRQQAVGFLREYHDWEWFEGHGDTSYPGYPQNQNGFSPAWTGDHWDAFYQSLKIVGGLQISPAINNSVIWLTGNNSALTENKPILAGSNRDPQQPASYIEHADHMFQEAARYGNHPVPDAQLKLRSDNARLTGLNLVHYYEDWNEQDKWWAGRDAYFSPYEYAAMASADDDGHLGALGTTVGVKNADPSAVLVMSGLANASIDYIKAVKLWCDYHRGGSFPFGVINVHHYSNNGGAQFNSTRGISPEADNLEAKMAAIRAYRDQYLPGVEFWVSEFGYDCNSASPQGAPAIGASDSKEVQAEWLVRSYLALAAAGVDRAMAFELTDNGPGADAGVYATSGLLNIHDQPKSSWWYVYTLKNRLAGLHYLARPASGNSNVRIYQFADAKNAIKAYVLWCPTSNGTTVPNYALTVHDGARTEDLIDLTAHTIGGKRTPLAIQNGKVLVNVSERPVIILQNNTAPDPVMTQKLALNPSMVTNLSGQGDAGQMVDEQTLAGDPREPNGGGAPITQWQTTSTNASAYIDLGQVRQLDRICLYDTNNVGQVDIFTGSPSHWTLLLISPLDSYMYWDQYVVNVSTRYVLVKKKVTSSNFNEIVLYGK